MSADNRICVMEYQHHWYVWPGSLSQDYHTPPPTAEICRSESSALQRAAELDAALSLCEGGVMIVDATEQALALTTDLEDLSMRLRRLLSTNSQWPS